MGSDGEDENIPGTYASYSLAVGRAREIAKEVFDATGRKYTLPSHYAIATDPGKPQQREKARDYHNQRIQKQARDNVRRRQRLIDNGVRSI